LVPLHEVVESTHVHLKFKFMCHSISMVFYFLKVPTFYQSLSPICKCQKHLGHIYPWSKVVCFVLFVTLRRPKPRCFLSQFWYLWKALMIRGALTLFAIVWSYIVEAIDYWTIFPMINFKNQCKKMYCNLGVFLVLLESPWQVRFNRFYFTIFTLKM
jgi:hypothetical protein